MRTSAVRTAAALAFLVTATSCGTTEPAGIALPPPAATLTPQPAATPLPQAQLAPNALINDGAEADVLAVRVPQYEEIPNPTGTHTFTWHERGRFNRPWAMSFVPTTNFLIVNEKTGAMRLRDNATGTVTNFSGVPQVVVAGQGGLGDVLVSPTYNGTTDRTVFLSWVEQGPGQTTGAVVARGVLNLSNPASPRLESLNVLWRQNPKVIGSGHFGHRLALSPNGTHLFVTSSDRNNTAAAQDPNSDLGKIIRINLSTGAAEHWTLGHRNPLGIGFAPDGRLWSSEMGPRNGDELNIIERYNNYGWPNVSMGDHYDGRLIPDHSPGDGYTAPRTFWYPSIAPGSLLIYTGDAFPNWKGDALLGGLAGRALVRVDIDGANATEAERWTLDDYRIRAVQQAPDGTIWLLEDGDNARLLQILPAS